MLLSYSGTNARQELLTFTVATGFFKSLILNRTVISKLSSVHVFEAETTF